jgi:hypothetical protein
MPKARTGGSGKIETSEYQPMPKSAETHSLLADIGAIFRLTILKQKYQPSSHAIHNQVSRDVLFQLGLDQSGHQVTFKLPVDIEAELLKFGFVQRLYSPPPSNENRIARLLIHQPVQLVFTSKFDRFGFWLEHNFDNLPAATIVARG